MKRLQKLLFFAAPVALLVALWPFLDAPTSAQASNDPPAVGEEAPTFTLVSNEGTEVDLKDYRDKWVVLYFYPQDFTGGCTIEAKNFERDMDQYEALNTVVLGVSVDSAESHDEFCTKEGLSFKLLADVTGTVSDLYGSLGESKRSTRNTFVIDPKGVVAKVFMKVNPNPHSAEVLSALKELQSAS
jgi:peroxiredoxin Q/BCP